MEIRKLQGGVENKTDRYKFLTTSKWMVLKNPETDNEKLML